MKTWRRLGVAALLSGAVHAAAITFSWFGVPQLPADLPPLAVSIVTVAPAIVTESPRPSVAPVPPKPRVVASITATATAPESVTESVPEFVQESAPPSPPAGLGLMRAPVQRPSEFNESIGPALVREGVRTTSEPALVATAPASTVAAETRTPSAFPRKGRITYNLLYGRGQFPVGLTVQSWEFDGTRYLLSSRSETTGIVDLFRSQHRTYASRGELTPEGLRPDTFLMSRNRGRGGEEAQAYFDWSRGSVSLGPPTERREQTLPSGSQDLVSFMYQLALAPPGPGRLRVPVTNGTRLETYELDVLPEEKIETPLGVLRALPVRQVRVPGTESIDLWLAVEYRHLPVRIRIYGRDGEPEGEQIVTEIRLSED